MPGNKLSDKLKKSNVQEIRDLLKDDSKDEILGRKIVEKAKEEGRFIELPPDSFVPDPNQPRKTIPKSSLEDLRDNIESNGQLQPILVGARLEDGRYPIIAGERRWRAIADLYNKQKASESDKVTYVQAIIRGGDLDELQVLLMQIGENNQREQVNAIENARSLKRVVDLFKSQGHNQEYAADVLNISAPRLSKILALLDAPAVIVDLSTGGETQDIEILYNLAKASESKPEGVIQLIDSWRSGELDTNFRQASSALAAEAKTSKREAKKAKADGSAKSEKTPAKATDTSEAIEGRRKKASAVKLLLENDEFVLTIELGNKKLSYKVDADTVLSLKDDIAKNWS